MLDFLYGVQTDSVNSSDVLSLNGTNNVNINTGGGLNLNIPSALTNSISNHIVLNHQTSGTPIAGIGVGISFDQETSINNVERGMIIKTVTTDVTATSEDFDFVVDLMAAGSVAAEKFRVTSTGSIKLNATSTIVAGSAYQYALPSASANSTLLASNGSTPLAGSFNVGTTTPTNTNRLNYEGNFYPTSINLSGTASIASAASHYFVQSSSDGFVRPKSLTDVRTEVVNQSAVLTAIGTTAVPNATNLTGTTSGVGGNLQFTLGGARITGDFSNATLGNRVMFQTSTANSATSISAIPNGTSTTSSFAAYNATDPTNSSTGYLSATTSEIQISADKTGTGNYKPLSFYTSGTTKFNIAADALGTFTFSGTSPRFLADFSNATLANRALFKTTTTNGPTTVGAIPNGTSTTSSFAAYNATDLTNSSQASIEVSNTEAAIRSGKNGTGSYLPLSFYTQDWRYMQINGNKISLSSVTAGFGWDSSTPVIDMLVGKSLWSDGVTNYSGNNLYKPQAGGTTYRNNGKATLITESYQNGTINLQIFPSGTADAAASTPVTSFGLDSTGNVLLTTPNGGLGYGVGAGGTVTQATNKSTDVTINKPTGYIYTSNSALAAGATAYFILRNSLITSADIPVMQFVVSPSTFTSNAYSLSYVSLTTIGGFQGIQIALKNISAGSLSETVIIGFSFIKGSSS